MSSMNRSGARRATRWPGRAMRRRLTTTAVITNYNYGRYLRRAVASVLGQSAPADRIVVIDDGSVDDSRQILSEMPREVEVILQENQGIIASRNRAIDMCRTSHITFLDADDVMGRRFLELTRCAWSLPHSDRLALAYTAVRLRGPNGTRVMTSAPWSQKMLGRQNYIVNTSLFQLEALKDIGGYSPRFESLGFEDWDLMLKLAESGWRGRFVPLCLVSYFPRPEGRNYSSIRKNGDAVTRALLEEHPWASPGPQGRAYRLGQLLVNAPRAVADRAARLAYDR
ncbi:glycosyltransferase [Acidimicrobiaceae bacterium USS-CC1]|uniref:Glycosyltransferase n=1 Tax=Acidiferrimicrobium australe TaxID=2664430 RepID=A0ABW9QTR7_9ACTN|nr:glycosyltransferase [Acidiferrimicrobium australe]